MILITILVLTALILLTALVFTASVGGAVFIVVFGDVIVCVWFIISIIKHIIKKKKS